MESQAITILVLACMVSIVFLYSLQYFPTAYHICSCNGLLSLLTGHCHNLWSQRTQLVDAGRREKPQ